MVIDGRMTWAGGLFAETDTADAISDSDARTFTCRITGLPLYEDEGRELVHLGFGYTYRSAQDTLRIRPRPESYLAPRYLDTGEFKADYLNTLNLEAGYVRGPFSLQAEYTWANVSGANRDEKIVLGERVQDLDWWARLVLKRLGSSLGEGLADFPQLAARLPALGDLAGTTVEVTRRGDVGFHAFYLQASYVLTGEHRTYRMGKGVFGPIVPDRPFGLRKGWRGPGAWEVAARISTIDLDDAFIRGGRETNYSLGINWYANPYVRMSANYIHADIDREGVDDSANIFQVRFQLDLKQKDVSDLRPLKMFRKQEAQDGGAD
jgi:phosphate-selective porin OprO/OprP